MRVFENDPNLAFNLNKWLDKDLYEYAKKELESFWQLCMNEFDSRASYTDRDGQPKLLKYNRYGEEVSEVWLNEGYKKTREKTYNTGIVAYNHRSIPELGRKGNYIYSYAQGYILSQVEPGFYCPVTLTMATAYLLDKYASRELKENYLPHVLSTGEVELFEGATFLTEKQGGSDVGANETKAVSYGDHYKLYGLKYFASNAGACGVATVLARMEGAPDGTKGLSLFLVPWKKANGQNNGLQIRRLKDKLGVRAVPSAEVEFDGAEAYLIGEASQGFYYMMEALNLSRICNAVASIGIMKRAYDEALKYAKQRYTFGQYLVEFPMIKETLTSLAARQEVLTSACFEMIHQFDRIMNDSEIASAEEKAMNRLLIALLKARTAEEAIQFAHEAIEMHGGNGYIEDFVTPRLLRDAQVLTVWEGTANILGLEVLRLTKKYKVHELFLKTVKTELAGLSLLPECKQAIETEIQELVKLLYFLENKEEDVLTYHAKRVAAKMCNIYTAIVALKDAQAAGSRKEKVAQLYCKHIWDKEGIDADMTGVRYFDEVIGRQVVKQ
jgi:acyl-CoA dehydrogenase